ncbi:acyltransferase family protein [uncultured Bacteroides sp.]|uniref:acyltransferase family protein n=1 Tax=uncultured Bacteroides sp. TaxID=162156 RepID=UPI002AAB3B50|nr:acyltransferase family protein [uncultured Bacteroides sp.]
MNQRINYIDLAKGICILLIILHHIQSPINQTEGYRMLTCFRVPLYFVLSGLFFKKYSGFINFILRKVNKLVVPFIFFLTLTYLIFSCLWGISGHINYITMMPQRIAEGFLTKTIYINIPLWFLVSLFETSVMFYLIISLADKLPLNKWYKEGIIAGICLLTGFTGYYLQSFHINLPLWIDSSMACLPFYYTGYFLRKETSVLMPNKADKYIPILLILFAVLVYFLAGPLHKISYLSYYVSAMSGTSFVLLLSKLAVRIPVVSFLGRYSVIILGIHCIIIIVLKDHLTFITNPWLLSATIFALVVLISIPAVKLLIRYLPWFVCQKDLIKVAPKPISEFETNLSSTSE